MSKRAKNALPKLRKLTRKTAQYDSQREITPDQARGMLSWSDAYRYLQDQIPNMPAQAFQYWIATGALPSYIYDNQRVFDPTVLERFCRSAQKRMAGELLTTQQARRYLTQRMIELDLREAGTELSNNTFMSWVNMGHIAPYESTMSRQYYTTGELDGFLKWFDRVKVVNKGRWSLPYGVYRVYEEPDADESEA